MSQTPILDSLRVPSALAAVPDKDLSALASELRSVIIATVARNGGHLAPNLGSVELTIALLRVFDPGVDRLVWDTGHQAYAYKLLTGRQELFTRLRQDRGCCGFLHRDESPYDVFGAGHAGTAISAALGFAAARDRRGGHERVVAVVGDGALGNAVALEGLNSVVEATDDFILVLNDNKMSIGPNVGALSRHLNRILSADRYDRIKNRIRSWIERIPRIGPRLRRTAHRVEGATKSLLGPGGVFEELGLRYIGPVDGHDIPSLVRVLRAARRMRRRVVVHVLTQKGHGYPPAESAPEHFHGLGSFDPEAPHFVDSNHSAGGAVTFSDQLGTSLLSLMAADDRVVAITAGMCHGTGLVAIRERFPERFFDVGIAEEHAVVFAAGLAAAGLRPIVAMYATFMQRAMDYVYHDVCLQKLPVIFCLDRAGVVADGPTHHGILDLGFWLGVPGLAVLQPADATEQDAMLAMALEQGVPTLIRYPRGKATAVRAQPALQWGRSAELRTGTAATIWALGREVQTAFETADLLASRGIDVGVTNVRFLTPFDREALLADARERPVVTLEDHVECAGLGLLAAATLQPLGQARLLARGYPREIVPFGTVEQIRRQYRLDPESLAEDIGRFVQGQTSTTAPIRQEASTPTTDTSADIPADRLQQ